MGDIHRFDEVVGLSKRGTIVGFDAKKGMLKVQLFNTSAIQGKPKPIDVPAPHSMFYNNGLFIGTSPHIGTPVVVSQGSGNQYYFVSFLAENQNYVPSLKPGELLIKSNNLTKIVLTLDNDVFIGSNNNNIHINTDSNYISTNFYEEFNFTQSSRKINGLIKRDKIINDNCPQSLKLEDDSYNSKYYVIGLDPSLDVSLTSTNDKIKNPPLVENREITYEFQYDANILDDLNESNTYSKSGTQTPIYSSPNRRQSRADTLSLSLVAPNFLMETVKGTVVDIFGNILDINRYPLPINENKTTLRNQDKKSAFLKIKELERKSIAYHFELNARKDPSINIASKNSDPLNNDNNIWARNRSRFFLDIDKEGQFKLNVPCSSDTGNIPLLTRYENYSTTLPDDNNNPNKLIFMDNNLDIQQDSFASPTIDLTGDKPVISDITKNRGSIEIKDGSISGSPQDRITKKNIKHGTAYHDILQTCYLHTTSDYLNYQNDEFDGADPSNLTININKIPKLKNIVQKILYTSGAPVNADGTSPTVGGRSGCINFDGSIELNIGANTSDRQSMWLDTAGGIVANIGRDLNNISAAVSLNGDLLLQVGGVGVNGDKRFKKQNNDVNGAAVDIRVLRNKGQATLIRIDDEGIKVLTPGNMVFHSEGGMRLTSDTSIFIESENVTIQGRSVLKEFGGSV